MRSGKVHLALAIMSRAVHPASRHSAAVYRPHQAMSRVATPPSASSCAFSPANIICFALKPPERREHTRSEGRVREQ